MDAAAARIILICSAEARLYIFNTHCRSRLHAPHRDAPRIQPVWEYQTYSVRAISDVTSVKPISIVLDNWEIVTYQKSATHSPIPTSCCFKYIKTDPEYPDNQYRIILYVPSIYYSGHINAKLPDQLMK